jgi:hypothetical protein
VAYRYIGVGYDFRAVAGFRFTAVVHVDMSVFEVVKVVVDGYKRRASREGLEASPLCPSNL